MSFSSIGWNGIGVINSCESTSGWAEDGGGNISANPDQYLQGGASIGSQYANKTGYTYYTHGTTYDFTGGGNAEGQKLYMWLGISSTSSLDILSTYGMSIILGDNQDDSRYWTVAGSDGDNGWSQGWKMFIIDPTTAGTYDPGTYDNTIIDTFGLWLDVAASVRAESIFIDEFAIADGLIAHSGTGTFDEILTYAWNTPITRIIGIFTEEGRFNYALGKFTLGDNTSASANTILTVTNKVIGFNTTEYYNGSSWISSVGSDTLYNIVHLEKHSSYTTEFNSLNSSFYGNENAWLTFSKESGAEYNFDGGTLERIKALTVDTDWTIQNASLNNVEAITVNGGTFLNNTVSSSVPLVASSTLSGCTFKTPTTHCITTADLNYLDKCNFESNDSNAVQLTSAGADFGWDCTLSGYDSGSAGDGVEVTGGSITGNEAIHVTATTGTFNITVASTGDTPSVSSAGAVVNVIAGAVDTTISAIDVAGDPVNGVAIALYAKDGTGPLPFENSVSVSANGSIATVSHTTHGMKTNDKALIKGLSNADLNGVYSITVTDADTYTYASTETQSSISGTSTWVCIYETLGATNTITKQKTYSSDQPVIGWVRKSTSSPYYKTGQVTGVIDSADGVSLTALMLSDE